MNPVIRAIIAAGGGGSTPSLTEHEDLIETTSEITLTETTTEVELKES